MRDSHILWLHISLGIVLYGHDFAVLLIPEDNWRSFSVNYSKNRIHEVARWFLPGTGEFTYRLFATKNMSRNICLFLDLGSTSIFAARGMGLEVFLRGAR